MKEVCRFSFYTTSLFLSILTELNKFDRRTRPGQQNERVKEAYSRKRQQNRAANLNLVPVRTHSDSGYNRGADRSATFGERRTVPQASKRPASDGPSESEMRWIPSSNGGGEATKKRVAKPKGVETFGAGMERGNPSEISISEGDRRGRTERRKGGRSGSKNTFRKM